nr:hypothetical protein L204_06512 [Cryptococcus depauperatus CBS 7855]
MSDDFNHTESYHSAPSATKSSGSLAHNSKQGSTTSPFSASKNTSNLPASTPSVLDATHDNPIDDVETISRIRSATKELGGLRYSLSWAARHARDSGEGIKLWNPLGELDHFTEGDLLFGKW